MLVLAVAKIFKTFLEYIAVLTEIKENFGGLRIYHL